MKNHEFLSTLKFLLCLTFLISTSQALIAQKLKPGFDQSEFKNLMLISTRSTTNPTYFEKYPEPLDFKMIYRSHAIGLDNMWDLWISPEKKAVISIRGTTEKAESWLANTYAAMVPAKGQLLLDNNDYFNYELSPDPKAAVHVGWLLSTAYLYRDMLPHITKIQKDENINDILIIGHSQGGAIAYLLTSHLLQQQKDGFLPKTIRFKTYCSAAPKPGNLYYAYSFESAMQGGWAFSVINAADWVPETPISIQTLRDFNDQNPFINAKKAIKKQKFPNNLMLTYAYNRLDKPTRKAQRNFEKYLGRMLSKSVVKHLKTFTPPTYYPSNHYVRVGFPIVLMPDSAYFAKYPKVGGGIMPHHAHQSYLDLLDQVKF